MTNFFHPSPLGQLDALYMSVGSIPCNHSLLSCEKKKFWNHIFSSNQTNSSPLVTSIPAISILWAFHLNYFPLFKFMCCSPQLLRIYEEITSITFHVDPEYFSLSPQLLSTFISITFHVHLNYFPLSHQLLFTFHVHLDYLLLSPQLFSLSPRLLSTLKILSREEFHALWGFHETMKYLHLTSIAIIGMIVNNVSSHTLLIGED